MDILINNLDILQWLWPNAELHFLQTKWSDIGEMFVYLRCEISAEESRKPLLDLGITTPIVDVYFHNVWRIKTDLRGDISSREVVVEWCSITRSPLIEEIRANGAATDVELVHHEIKGSSGSKIELVFEKVLLKEIAVTMNMKVNAIT